MLVCRIVFCCVRQIKVLSTYIINHPIEAWLTKKAYSLEKNTSCWHELQIEWIEPLQIEQFQMPAFWELID